MATSIKLDSEVEKRLEQLAASTGISKTIALARLFKTDWQILKTTIYQNLLWRALKVAMRKRLILPKRENFWPNLDRWKAVCE